MCTKEALENPSGVFAKDFTDGKYCQVVIMVHEQEGTHGHCIGYTYYNGYMYRIDSIMGTNPVFAQYLPRNGSLKPIPIDEFCTHINDSGDELAIRCITWTGKREALIQGFQLNHQYADHVISTMQSVEPDQTALHMREEVDYVCGVTIVNWLNAFRNHEISFGEDGVVLVYLQPNQLKDRFKNRRIGYRWFKGSLIRVEGSGYSTEDWLPRNGAHEWIPEGEFLTFITEHADKVWVELRFWKDIKQEIVYLPLHDRFDEYMLHAISVRIGK